MKVDYIIVGCGLAGISFCEALIANNKSFMVYNNNSQQSSTVAGGLYNPVTLKRFTSVWKSKEQLKLALLFYRGIEARLKIKLDYKTTVYRRFTSLEEQNDWFSASDKPTLNDYLSLKIHKNFNSSLDVDFGFGEVLQSGRIDTKLLIEEYKSYLKTNNQITEEDFDYARLDIKEENISYKPIEAKHIVFAEGYGLKGNPFFKNLPLYGSKGELLTIYAPKLKMDFVLKSSVFIIPLGEDLYRIGATYEREDKTNRITPKAREELLEKLKTVLVCDFEVVDQVAGIRPTVKDRKPLIGSHPKQKNLYVLNGLGTRGVMIGPYVANQLYHYIENDTPLDNEIDINRFED